MPFEVILIKELNFSMAVMFYQSVNLSAIVNVSSEYVLHKYVQVCVVHDVFKFSLSCHYFSFCIHLLVKDDSSHAVIFSACVWKSSFDFTNQSN